MATRNFVPRANGEGKIGTPAKHWGDVYADALHGNLSGTALTATDATNAMNDVNGVRIDTTYIKKDSDYLGYRQPSTAQSVGDMRYHATLPTGWYLECTTAGTTGSGTLTITSPTVGGTVSDGTVTWTIRKNASTQDLTAYLPLSGGSIANGTLDVNSNRIIITKSIHSAADADFMIKGGAYGANGSALSLYGPSYSVSKDAGSFSLSPAAGYSLRGYSNNELKWGNNSLDKSAVVAESLGTNGYRKYASGLIEQWGRFRNVSEGYMPAGVYTVTFPISFPTVCEPIVSSTEPSSLGITHLNKDSMDITFSAKVFELYWHAIGY